MTGGDDQVDDQNAPVGAPSQPGFPGAREGPHCGASSGEESVIPGAEVCDLLRSSQNRESS